MLTRTSSLEANAEAYWQALPPHFRLQGPLIQSTQTPFNRDLLVSIRLNHLHVLFLLRLALQRTMPESDVQLLEISSTMLSLTVEAIICKEHLVNSGTGLIWKVISAPLHATLRLMASARPLRITRCRYYLSFFAEPVIQN